MADDIRYRSGSRLVGYLAGHRFEGPNGQAYELVRDVFIDDYMTTDQFHALNGAPKPQVGQPMPSWLAKQVLR